MATDIYDADSLGQINWAEIPPYEARQESVFSIRIGHWGLLVPVELYCEVWDKAKVSPFPDVHPWLTGLLNLRGNLAPLFDLHKVFSESSAVNKTRKLLSLGRGEKMVAVWIDTFPEVKTIAALQRLEKIPVLPEHLRGYVSQAYQQDGQVWLMVEFEALIQALGHHQYSVTETGT